MDIETLRNQILGSETALDTARQNERIFLKAQGLSIAEEKTRGEVLAKEESLKEKKAKLKKLRLQKAEAMRPTLKGFSDKMGEVLPGNEAAIFEVTDGKVFIGWGDAPYEALSGGQQAAFNGALAHVFDSDVLVYEAAESDYANLEALLSSLSETPKQVIVCTWVDPSISIGADDVKLYDVPESFDVIRL